MLIYSVYYIQNHPKDGQPYVGCTKNLKSRMQNHGVSVNEIEILWVTDDIRDASLIEQDMQKRLVGKSDGLLYYTRTSEERNKKLGDSVRGIPKSEDARQAMRDSHRGTPAHNKGVPMSEEQKEKIRNKKRGVPLGPKSDEHKQRLSDSHLGITHSAETRQAMSDNRRGVPKGPMSEETKRKIGDKRRERCRQHRLSLSYNQEGA